jgi:hypothetical protein
LYWKSRGIHLYTFAFQREEPEFFITKFIVSRKRNILLGILQCTEVKFVYFALPWSYIYLRQKCTHVQYVCIIDIWMKKYVYTCTVCLYYWYLNEEILIEERDWKVLIIIWSIIVIVWTMNIHYCTTNCKRLKTLVTPLSIYHYMQYLQDVSHVKDAGCHKRAWKKTYPNSCVQSWNT